MVWACGRILEEDGTTSHSLSDLLLVIFLNFFGYYLWNDETTFKEKSWSFPNCQEQRA